MSAHLSMSETAFQASVIQLAQLHRWRVAHFRPAMTKSGRYVTAVAADGKGFPDLVLARPAEVTLEHATDPERMLEEYPGRGFEGKLEAAYAETFPREGRVIFAELKAEGAYAEPEQRAWLTTLAFSGAEVYVWRPSDWHAITVALGRDT